MSHTVQVNLTADQVIHLNGVEINIHNLSSITLNNEGKVIDFRVEVKRDSSRILFRDQLIYCLYNSSQVGIKRERIKELALAQILEELKNRNGTE